MAYCEHFARRPYQKQNNLLAIFLSRPGQIRKGTVEKNPWSTSIPDLTFFFRVVHFLWEITYCAYDTDLETIVSLVVLLVSYVANDSWGLQPCVYYLFMMACHRQYGASVTVQKHAARYCRGVDALIKLAGAWSSITGKYRIACLTYPVCNSM
jgi:hypothetical protein